MEQNYALVQTVTAAEDTAGPSATVVNEACSHNQGEGVIKHLGQVPMHI